MIPTPRLLKLLGCCCLSIKNYRYDADKIVEDARLLLLPFPMQLELSSFFLIILACPRILYLVAQVDPTTGSRASLLDSEW